jgi:amino acid adenylation domain-containing protein
VKTRLPLTLAQSSIFHHQCHNEGVPFYNVGGYIRLENPCIERLMSAHARLVQSFEAFGTRIHIDTHGVFQSIVENRTRDLPLVDLSARQCPQQAADEWLEQLFSSCIPLENNELYRSYLLKLTDTLHYYVGMGHHIALDGIGFVNWAEALARIYSDSSQQELQNRAEFPIRLLVDRDLAYHGSERYERDRRYWGEKLTRFNDCLFPLPQHHSQHNATARSRREILDLSPQLHSKLMVLSERVGAERHQLVLALLAVYFSQIYSADSVVFGTPLHNRHSEEERAQIGLFTRMVPLLVEVAGEDTLARVLEKNRRAQQELLRHRHYPIIEIANHPQNRRDKNQLFDIGYSYLPVGRDPLFDSSPGKLVYCSHHHELSPLLVTYWDAQGAAGTAFHFDYNLAYISPGEITSVITRLLHLVDQLLENPDVRMAELHLITSGEKQRLLEKQHSAPAPFDLGQLFNGVLARSPAGTALEGLFGKISYADLEQRVTRVAAALQHDFGVARADRVGVFLPRCADLVVMLLALVRLRAVYIPIDWQYPAARIHYILCDSKVRLLVTHSQASSLLDDLPALPRLMRIDQAQLSECHPSTEALRDDDGIDPMYILYTSGSTGAPKGVSISRHSVENLLGGLTRHMALSGGGRWLFLSSVAFDISIVEWLGALALGNTCVIPSESEVSDPFAIAQLLNTAGITYLQGTPSRLRQLLDAGWHPAQTQRVMSAGEPLTTELAQRLLGCNVELWNGYGPTEATVYSLVKRVLADESPETQIVIGDQLPGYRHYVLNKHHALVPPGVPGELVIAGRGLALEYVNLSEHTAARFTASSQVPEQRFYKSGDIVRQLQAGGFQYLGRTDDQIKLRGFRVELKEIETAIARIPCVRNVAVVHRKAEGDKPAQLIAYVCLRSDGQDAEAEGFDASELIRHELSKWLPAYMVPTAIVLMDELPTNNSGKLDKNRLPVVAVQPAQDSSPLESEGERLVARIWSEVLQVPLANLARHSDFFALGGDSLLAVKIVAQLREAALRQVEVSDLLHHPRLGDMAARLLEIPGRLAWEAIPIVERGAAAHPTSTIQKQIWHLSMQDAAVSNYNMAACYRVSGPLSPYVLENSLARLLLRHEILRTLYAWTADGLQQSILAAPQLKLTIVDCSSLGEAEQERAINTELVRNACFHFDLTKDIPFRAGLIRVEPNIHILSLNIHHIAADGWSIRLLIQELLTLYQSLAAGQDGHLPSATLQYVDFAAWQGAKLAQGAWDSQLEHWKQALADIPPTHALPLDFARPKMKGEAGECLEREIEPRCMEQLRHWAQAHSVTEFTLLQSAFALLISKWSFSDEVVVGSPVLGRGSPQLQACVGMFVNLLPYVHRFRLDERFSEYLIRFQRQATTVLENQDIPFERVVEALRPERDPSHHPIFQLLFAVQEDLLDRVEIGGLRFERLADDRVATKFDLELLVSRDGDGSRCSWIFDPELFDRHSVAGFASAYGELLQLLAQDPQRTVGDIGLWNSSHSSSEHPGARAVVDAGVAAAHQLFEKTARLLSDHVAVCCGDEALTYRELNVRANRLAHSILADDIAPGSLIALHLPRGIDLIAATLAILKAGCAYVPVDPSYPSSRQSYIFADANAACVLTTTQLAASNAAALAGRSLLCLDDPNFQKRLAHFSSADIDPSQVSLSPESLAYVIHTSGSTGKPKGVLIAHRGLINLAIVQSRAFGITSASRVLQFASFSFDAAVSEWSTALCTGATLVMVPEDVAPDVAQLTDWVRDHAVTHATLPPVVLKRLDPTAWPTLTHVISAGESITLEEAQRWSAHCRFINAYGPTESTVCASIGGINARAGKVTIGYAMQGFVLHVLDKGMNPVAPGALGELCIGGVGLAKGYLNEPELTRKAFVTLPVGNGVSVQIYRTGDLVRQLCDGELVFAGRIDAQVKIRGHRVECGEIESCIASHALVKEVCVCPRLLSSGETVLVAHIVANPQLVVSREELVDDLRKLVAANLPSYMVPSFIVPLQALPLNQSGTVDRKLLAVVDLGQVVAPRARQMTPTEQTLLAIWTAALDTESADLERRFFELGGHSLLVSDVLMRIAAQLDIKLFFKQFFEHDSIAALAQFIDHNRESLTPTQSGQLTGSEETRNGYPLSFEQQRIWFIDQMEQGSRHYNMPVALNLEGTIVPEFLAAALRRIVQRHESLRTVFCLDALGEPVQVVRDSFSLELQRLTLAPDRDRDEAVTQLSRSELSTPFNLREDLPIRAKLLTLSSTEAVLFLTLHHVAADGRSVDRLIAEFSAIHDGLARGEDCELPPLPLQYKDYALQQRRLAGSDAWREGMEFWRHYLDGAPQVHSLPLDYPRPAAQSLQGMTRTTIIPGDLVQRLKELSRGHNTTLFVTLQAVFSLLIARWSTNRDVLIGTPVANRNSVEVAGLIGFFANTLALRADCRENLRFSELLRRCRDGFLNAYQHQYIPFDVCVDELKVERSLAHPPLIQILFVLQDNLEQKMTGLTVAELSCTVLRGDAERPAKFDLEVTLSECAQGLACEWLYDTALFTPETIRRLFEAYRMILQAVLRDPDCRIHQVEIVTDSERALLLRAPKPLPAAVATGGLIAERFAELARRAPERIAVIHERRQLTYRELERRSSQLASWLAANGFAGGAPVAVYMRRGIDLVIAVLAIMKSGSPYLPLDLGYPSQRVQYILQDCSAPLLLCDRESASRLETSAVQFAIRCVDDEAFINACRGQPDSSPVPQQTQRPGGLAYVVYTSGSSGQPKGVMVRQESFLNLVLWYIHDYGFNEQDRCLLLGSIGFDMTQKNVFAPLLSGGVLVIPDEYYDPAAVATVIAEHGVTTVNCAPSAMYPLVEKPDFWPQLASLRLAALGGEAIKPGLLRAWLRSEHCRARLLNMYGPSECTDISIARDYDRDEAARHEVTLPIGWPIYNCTAYVLNEQRRLQPRGVPGELYLGGVGVSNGYVNNEELNRRCFVNDVIPGAGRLYRTGDLARMLPDGSFDYLGRVDQQVKIRGYRVETAEIDAVIAECPQVKQSFTLAWEGPQEDKALVSFVVLTGLEEPTDEQLHTLLWQVREKLVARLPGYMIPAKFMPLDALPLTPNGKVDRIRLVSETASGSFWQLKREYRAPRNETETLLQEIWQELLGRDNIGIDDNFFELGGHSLLVTRLISKVTPVFAFGEASLSVKELFQNPTIETAARLIELKSQYGRLLAKEKTLLASDAGIEEGSF